VEARGSGATWPKGLGGRGNDRNLESDLDAVAAGGTIGACGHLVSGFFRFLPCLPVPLLASSRPSGSQHRTYFCLPDG
jgi:hypothetical protein